MTPIAVIPTIDCMAIDANVECPHCHVRMAEGFALDRGHADNYAIPWVQGEPEERKCLGLVLPGLKLKGRASFAICAYRCPACGYVALYAKEPVKVG